MTDIIVTNTEHGKNHLRRVGTLGNIELILFNKELPRGDFACGRFFSAGDITPALGKIGSRDKTKIVLSSKYDDIDEAYQNLQVYGNPTGIEEFDGLRVDNPTTPEDYARNLLAMSISGFCDVQGNDTTIRERMENQSRYLDEKNLTLSCYDPQDYERARRLGIGFECGHDVHRFKFEGVTDLDKTGLSFLNAHHRIYGIPTGKLEGIDDHFLLQDQLRHAIKGDRSFKEDLISKAVHLYKSGQEETGRNLIFSQRLFPEEAGEGQRPLPSPAHFIATEERAQRLLEYASNSVKTDYELNQETVALSNYLVEQAQ